MYMYREILKQPIANEHFQNHMKLLSDDYVGFYHINNKRNHSSIFAALATCRIKGDPHTLTFDKKHFNFQHICSYTLLQHGTFQIIGNTQPCYKHRTCLESVEIHHLGHVVKMGQGHELTIDGTSVMIPYISADFEITTTGGHTHAKVVSNDISVTWNGKKEADISVTDAYSDLVAGMF